MICHLFNLAITDAGGSVYSTMAPSLAGASCTRSQRSIESKSMESFFGARSDFLFQNKSVCTLGGAFSSPQAFFFSSFVLQVPPGQTEVFHFIWEAGPFKIPLSVCRDGEAGSRSPRLPSPGEWCTFARRYQVRTGVYLVESLSCSLRCVCSWPQERSC